MRKLRQLAKELIAEAERREGIYAGIAAVEDVLSGPSYRAEATGTWRSDRSESAVSWMPDAHCLLVLAMHHPKDEPGLDWFDRGNTEGNRRMTAISEALASWLSTTHGVRAQPLPYHVEGGGVFLKDAAVFAGLGVVGKNNLLVSPKWGPRVRLRSVLIEGRLPSNEPLENFDPCSRCPMPCRKACPVNAFHGGRYSRPDCIQRLEADRGSPIESGQKDSEGRPILVTEWCRRCEFKCPAGDQ
jgi:epoxyqueuosine reductase